MDVGAGTGILSLFAAKAGAKIVHSVEASKLSELIPKIAKENGFSDVIKVHNKTIESMELKDLIFDKTDKDFPATAPAGLPVWQES